MSREIPARIELADLKIRVCKAEQAKPETVVTIPLTVVWVATNLLPENPRGALKEGGRHG